MLQCVSTKNQKKLNRFLKECSEVFHFRVTMDKDGMPIYHLIVDVDEEESKAAGS